MLYRQTVVPSQTNCIAYTECPESCLSFIAATIYASRHLLTVLRETPTKCAIRFMLMPQPCIVFIWNSAPSRRCPLFCLPLGRPRCTFCALFHNQVKNRHNHKKASAQARKIAAYNQVVFLYVRKKLAKLAFVRRECSADCLFNPGIHLKRILFAEPQNLEPLILNCLSVLTRM